MYNRSNKYLDFVQTIMVFFIFFIPAIFIILFQIHIMVEPVKQKDEALGKGIAHLETSYVNCNIYTVTFKINGNTYKSPLILNNHHIEDGQKVKFYYKVDNPNQYAQLRYINIAMLVPIFLEICTLIGLFMPTYIKIRKFRLKKSLIVTGELVYAKYIKTIELMNFSVFNKHPYQILCEAEDAFTNTTSNFVSYNLWHDPRPIIAEKNLEEFPVYIDPENPNNYFIDTSILKKNSISTNNI